MPNTRFCGNSQFLNPETYTSSLASNRVCLGAVAQFERSLIAERVRSGLADARANDKILGRPPLRKSTRKVANLRRLRVRDNVPFRALAKEFGVSVRPRTLWKALLAGSNLDNASRSEFEYRVADGNVEVRTLDPEGGSDRRSGSVWWRLTPEQLSILC